MSSPALAATTLEELLSTWPAADYRGLRQAAMAWEQLALDWAATHGTPRPWYPVTVIPGLVTAVHCSPGGDQQKDITEKRPAIWTAVEFPGEPELIKAQGRRWATHSTVQKLPEALAAIAVAEARRLPIGLGLVLRGDGGAVAFDVDRKGWPPGPDGDQQFTAATAAMTTWAAANGCYLETTPGGGIHLIGLRPADAPRLPGKFAFADPDAAEITAGEIRGGGSNGFLVIAPTFRAGKPTPYRTAMAPTAVLLPPLEQLGIQPLETGPTARSTSTRAPRPARAYAPAVAGDIDWSTLLQNPDSDHWFERELPARQIELAISMLQAVPRRGVPDQSGTYDHAFKALAALVGWRGPAEALTIVSRARWDSPYWDVADKAADIARDPRSGIGALIKLARDHYGWKHPDEERIEASRAKRARRHAPPPTSPNGETTTHTTTPQLMTATASPGHTQTSTDNGNGNGNGNGCSDALLEDSPPAGRNGNGSDTTNPWAQLEQDLTLFAMRWPPEDGAQGPERLQVLQRLLQAAASLAIGADNRAAATQQAKELFVRYQALKAGAFNDAIRPLLKAHDAAEREAQDAHHRQQQQERQAQAQIVRAAQPFTIRGWDQDRKAIHYQNTTTGQWGALPPPAGRGSSGLLAVAPLEFWQEAFPKDDGTTDWLAASDWFITEANNAPIYRPENRRGRGVWIDDGRIVWHLGDRLLVDGQPTALVEIKSTETYDLGRPLPIEELGPQLNNTQGAAILDALAVIGWVEPSAPYLVAGWAVCASVGGALDHRPGLQTTGGSGNGKSTALELGVLPLLGGFIELKANISEAAIRQQAKGDVLPVLIDESEQGDDRGGLRAGHLRLLRHSYNGNIGGRGTTHGQALEHRIRYAVALCGINATIPQGADRSRVAIVTRRRLDAPSWAVAKAKVENAISPAIGQALIRRTVAHLHTLKANIRAFAAAIEATGDTARSGDAYGAMLAGAHLLVSTEQLTTEAAAAWLHHIGWAGADAQSEEEAPNEGRQCLDQILAHPVRWNPSPTGTITVGELAQSVLQGGSSHRTAFADDDAANRIAALGRLGVKVLAGVEKIAPALAIANNTPGLLGALKDTRWAHGGHRAHLRSLPGAEAGPPSGIRFAGDHVRRSVVVPWDAAFAPEQDAAAASRTRLA